MTTPPPARLGRGLAALISEMTEPARAESPEAAVRSVSIDLLDPGTFQPRAHMDEAALEELAASIRARGLLQPILVRPHSSLAGRYEIIAGERRWRAAQLAGLVEIPALIRDLGPEDAMAAALVENLQRQDLNAIEEADGYRRLQDEFGLTQEQLAEAIGKSRSHVANITRLLRLPDSVQHHVRRGVLSAGHARALLSHSEPSKGAMAVISRGLNVRQTEELANRSMPGHARARRTSPTDTDTQAVERTLTAHLGIRVQILQEGSRGVVRLHYNSLEQLDGLVTLLTR